MQFGQYRPPGRCDLEPFERLVSGVHGLQTLTMTHGYDDRRPGRL